MPISIGDEPLISVVIPIYNVEQYLERCLTSVSNQDYKLLDIILVDDGSTDNSGKIAETMATRDRRMKVYHKENGGLSDARNFGIKKVSGELICFVDSDDYLPTNSISILYGVMKGTKANIVIGDALHINENDDEVVSDFGGSGEIEVMDWKEAASEMLYQKSFLPSAWGKLYRADLFSNINFPVGKLFEDIAIMGELFEKAEKIAYLKKQIYAYVHREKSITTSIFSIRDLYILTICEYYETKYSNNLALSKASVAYHTNCCLRVLLNAPEGTEYSTVKSNCISYLHKNAVSVIIDKNVRLKTRIGLLIFIFARPLIRSIWKKVPRWKS